MNGSTRRELLLAPLALGLGLAGLSVSEGEIRRVVERASVPSRARPQAGLDLERYAEAVHEIELDTAPTGDER